MQHLKGRRVNPLNVSKKLTLRMLRAFSVMPVYPSRRYTDAITDDAILQAAEGMIGLYIDGKWIYIKGSKTEIFLILNGNVLKPDNHF